MDAFTISLIIKSTTKQLQVEILNIYYQKNGKVYFERNLFISHAKLMKNSFLNECIGLHTFRVLNRHLDPQRTREECSCLQDGKKEIKRKC